MGGIMGDLMAFQMERFSRGNGIRDQLLRRYCDEDFLNHLSYGDGFCVCIVYIMVG